MQGEVNPPGDVIVDTDVTVTVGSSGTLNVNFATNNLRIKNGAKVVIKDGGKID